MKLVKQSPTIFLITLLFTNLYIPCADAIPFGIYEPRSLAMGGAGVATASGENAVFYNPAILSTYTKYKEDAKNESFSFPTVSIRASKALETLAAQRDTDYEANLNNSIANYNTSQTAANAQAVVGDVSSLLGTLGEVANNVFLLDASAALTVGIPSKYQGGAFFITQRGVGDGQLNIPAADLELLNRYQEELANVAAGGAPGALHPELYSAGNLTDPSANIVSSATARAVTIREFGISMSKQFNIMGSDIAFGLSPKIVEVTTYEYQRTISSSQEDRQGTTVEDWLFNLDFGVFKKINAQWQVGLVVKNLIERDYPTASGQHISFKPQWRAGIAHLTPLITYTLDMDLLPNEGVYPGNKTQFVMAGMEIKQNALRYRLGYRDVIAHSGPREAGVFSGGLGLNFKPFYFDLAYSENHQQRAASLMFGFNF